MKLSQEINTIVENRIGEFINIITHKYSLPKSELLQIWGEIGEIVTEKTSEKEEVEETKTIEKVETNQKGKCVYTYSRGARKGQKCLASVKCGDFCCKHNKSKTAAKIKNEENRIVMKRHKIFQDFFWHPETNFLLKTKKEGVCAKLIEERGEVKKVPLLLGDFELCKSWGFKFKVEDKTK